MKRKPLSAGIEYLEPRTLWSGATGTVVLQADFTHSQVDPKVWHLPASTAGGGTVLGRTIFRTSPGPLPPTVNGSVRLPLDTHNPKAAGSFYGTDLISNKTFFVYDGLIVKFRARLNAPTAGGI